MSRREAVAWSVIVWVAYVATGLFGLSLEAVSRFATFVWPPAGISLAALLLSRLRLWPSIFLGAFTVNWVLGAPLLGALGIAIGNTLEGVVGAYLLIRFLKIDLSLRRMKDLWSLFFYAGALSTLVASTWGVLILWTEAVILKSTFFQAWRAWWLGDMLGDILIAPVILTWADVWTKKKWEGWDVRWQRVFELAVLFSALVGVCVYSLCGYSAHGGRAPLSFTVFPFIIWAAVRFEQAGTSTAILVMSCIAIYAATSQLGVFSFGDSEVGEKFFYSLSFMGVVAVTGMSLAAIESERSEALRLRDEFLSIVSHELNTPLTTMRLQLDVSKRHAQASNDDFFRGEKLKKTLETNERQLERLTKLVEELLDISKIETGRLPVSSEVFDLSKVASDVVSRLSYHYKVAGVELHYQSPGEILVEWDKHRVEQVFDNLLLNALKYGLGKPVHFKIESDPNGNEVVFSVRDQGCGIAKENCQRIFRKFERIFNDGVAVQGLGLGLFIVDHVVLAHNGSIKVQSELGQGSTFIVRIPKKINTA